MSFRAAQISTTGLGALLGAVFALTSTAASVRAELPPTRPMLRAEGLEQARLGVSISGGASLGAFEAGSMYVLIETLRRNADKVRPHVISGTSAGAVNAFLSLLSYCGAPEPDPAKSSFYETWMALGFEELYDEDAVTSRSVFSRKAFGDLFERLRARFSNDIRPDCELILGLTATRLEPIEVSKSGGRLRLPRMSSQFLLRFEGQPSGPPRVSNHPLTRERAMPRLPVEGPGAEPYDRLLELILASTSVPLAFGAMDVEHCVGSHSKQKCEGDETRKDAFVDGGFFDQNPVELSAAAVLHDHPEVRTSSTGFFYLLEPFVRSYPRFDVEAEVAEGPGALDMGLSLLGGFVESARFGQLEELLRSEPAVERGLVVSSASYPPYGDLGLFFLSFFERGFRAFDFVLGMLEAERALTGSGLPMSASDWAPLRCVRAVLAGDVDIDTVPECRRERHRLVPLAQVSLERVYEACRPDRIEHAFEADPARIRAHAACARAVSGEAPPGAGEDWRRRPDEGDVEWVFRRLGARSYRFQSLGKKGDADKAYLDLRNAVADATRAFARKQPSLRALYAAGAKTLVDRIAYRPSPDIIHLSLGITQEIGYSRLLFPDAMPWLRGDIVLELQGLGTVLSFDEPYVGLSPMLGLSFELMPLSFADSQYRLGVRGGYMASTLDGFGTGTCGDPGDVRRPCSRPWLEGQFTASFYNLLRLSLLGQWGPALRSGEPELLGVTPMIGIQLDL